MAVMRSATKARVQVQVPSAWALVAGSIMDSPVKETDCALLDAAKMSTPGVEPGLSRPQRDVLTTRRCGLLKSQTHGNYADGRSGASQ